MEFDKLLVESYENFKKELTQLGADEKQIEKAIKEKFSEEEIRIIEEYKEKNSIKPLTIQELLEVLGITIKHDNLNKLITFLSMLSAYTEDSQFNVSFRAPSSTGKSYIPIELARYFPPEDVIIIAYSSPTAFYHDAGEWDEEKQAIVVNLERKILIFLDQPHDQLLQRLRPLLSHDRKELLYKITDRKEKKGLRTKNVIIRGFPSVIFCTGSLKIDEQEATRSFVLSPETSVEKIREGIFLKALRKGNPLAFQEFLKDGRIEMLRKRIEKIKQENVKHVIIEDVNKVAEKFIEKYPKLKPRYQRDIERIISLGQTLALLNLWDRKRDEEGNVYANEDDINNAFNIFEKIAESQELGIPPFVYNFFKEVIEPLWKEVNSNNESQIGLTRKQIIAKYYEVYGRAIQDWALRQEILPALECAGLIFEDVDPNDKRRKLIYLSTPQCNSLFLNNHLPKNSERECGVGNFFSGKCSYCGKDGEVTWFNGNLICKDCLKIEDMKKDD
jgi:DNA-binding MarR family transcriptional regulator